MSSQQSKADLIAERQSNLPVPERPISAGPSSQSPNIVPTKKRKNRNRREKNSTSGAASTSESAGVQIERRLCANCYLFVKTDGLEYRQCDVCEVTYWCSKCFPKPRLLNCPNNRKPRQSLSIHTPSTSPFRMCPQELPPPHRTHAGPTTDFRSQ